MLFTQNVMNCSLPLQGPSWLKVQFDFNSNMAARFIYLQLTLSNMVFWIFMGLDLHIFSILILYVCIIWQYIYHILKQIMCVFIWWYFALFMVHFHLQLKRLRCSFGLSRLRFFPAASPHKFKSFFHLWSVTPNDISRRATMINALKVRLLLNGLWKKFSAHTRVLWRNLNSGVFVEHLSSCSMNSFSVKYAT